jgi:APA family basic amino acid/polyamine antiporter
VVEVLGLVAIIIAGFFFVGDGPVPAQAPGEGTGAPTIFGLAMVFVLLTYGGWNDAAYLSAEIKDGRRNIARSLLIGLGLVTALYILVSLAYLNGLGIVGMAKSDAPAATLLEHAWGPTGGLMMSIMVAVAAITSANATILTGARTSYALGRDWSMFRWLGRWNGERGTPVNAMLVQAAIALGLILMGTITRKGFETMVDYTAPVFWFFFMLVGASVFVLRRRDPGRERPFTVPWYPVLPAVFVLTCAYLLYSSLAYVRVGAWVGVGVLAVGAVLLFFAPKGDVK